jgi:hypothetical protein
LARAEQLLQLAVAALMVQIQFFQLLLRQAAALAVVPAQD